MQTARKISVADVLKLEIPERIRLVEAIWDSIAEVPEAVELTAEQREELDRRLRLYGADPRGGSPWSDVKERVLGRR